MSDYKKILVALDFSPASPAVGRRAADLAERYDADLILLHVVEYLPPLDVGYDPITTSEWTLDENELVKNAENSFRSLAEKLGLGAAKRLVQVGMPKQLIPEIANEEDADLIVIGTHGRQGIGRLLGSTADGVMHSADHDVLAVRITDES